MENKRFEVTTENSKKPYIYDNELDESLAINAIDVDEICDLLNKLHEENQSLKKFIKELTNE